MTTDSVVTQRIALKALIVNNEGKILILREANSYEEGTNIGCYHLPGGRLGFGESYLEGLRREVKEETGLSVKVGRPFYVGEWWPTIKGEKNQIVAVFFVCEPGNGEILLSREHDEFLWVLPSEAKNYNIMPPGQEVIDSYLAPTH